MIEGRKLAIYAFLTEIGACNDKMMVFDDSPEPSRYELEFVLESALQSRVAGLIQNMLAFMDYEDRWYFTEQAVMLAAREYARLPWVDNTFYQRFKALDNCTVPCPIEADLPF